MSVVENILIDILALMMIRFIGINGVWLSSPFAEIICIIVVAISVMINAKKLTFTLDDWMKLGAKQHNQWLIFRMEESQF